MLLFYSVTISLNVDSPFATASHSQAVEEKVDYDSKADKDFAVESNKEAESLGDVDSNIKAEEVEDLDADLEKIMPLPLA